jgi:hypothetical protein
MTTGIKWEEAGRWPMRMRNEENLQAKNDIRIQTLVIIDGSNYGISEFGYTLREADSLTLQPCVKPGTT